MKLRHPYTPQSLGLELDKPLESITFLLLLAFVASAPFPWGAVLPTGLLKIELFAFAIATMTLASRASLAPLKMARVPIIFLTALASLGMLQLIPLPAQLLETITPGSHATYQQVNEILGVYGRPELLPRISIAPSGTRSMVLFLLALASLGASSVVLLSSRRRRRTFLGVFLASAVIQTLVATSTFGVRTTGRISGTFVNPNHFSAYLEIAFACSLGLLWREVLMSRDRGLGAKDRGERLEHRILPISLSALLVGALGVGIGLTKSRGGIAAAVIMILIFLFLGFLHQRLRQRTRTLVLGLSMITLAFLFIAMTAKNEPILRYLESDPQELAADTRLLLWKTSIEAWKDFPLLGSGLGTFREAYRSAQPREIPQLVEQAHSDPIQLLVTGGLVGLMLGLATFFACLTILVRAYLRQRHREEFAFTLGGLGALIVIGLHGLVEFNLSIPAIPATLSCVIGFALAAAQRGETDRTRAGTSAVEQSPDDSGSPDLDPGAGFSPDT